MKVGVLALSLFFAVGAAQAQFKWTDANGKVYYGDNPPRDARNITRVGSAAADPADPFAGFPFELRRAVENFPVTLYTSSNCGPCDAGRSLLQARGVPFAEKTVSSEQDIEELQRLGLGKRVPVLVAGRQNVKEFETSAWHALLDSAGYPRTSRLPRTWTAPAAQPLVARSKESAQPADGSTPAPRQN
ncbi:MAG TPA: glutaredoxin family protein [Burkholderiaceae bacterium]|nr:glutaredoxin family protein [Burkholderiaceae bacterium]